jgi:hypothetical protein
MTVTQLKKALEYIIDPDNTLVVIPDYSLCGCDARDGNYSPKGGDFVERPDGFSKHRFILE